MSPGVDRKVDSLPLTCMSRTDQAWLQTASATWAAVAMRRGELTFEVLPAIVLFQLNISDSPHIPITESLCCWITTSFYSEPTKRRRTSCCVPRLPLPRAFKIPVLPYKRCDVPSPHGEQHE